MNIGGIDSGFNMLKVDNLVNKPSENKFEEIINALTSKNNDDKALRKACMDFEAIFLRMIYKQMRSSLPKSDFMPKSSATEIYEDMFDEKLVDEMVKGKGIGLGDTLYKAMRRQNSLSSGDGGGQDEAR